MASECLSCSRFLALLLLHCVLQSKYQWFKCGMTFGSALGTPRLIALSLHLACAAHSQQLSPEKGFMCTH